MTFWTLERVAKALDTGYGDARALRGIATDTRKLTPGDFFLALRGDRFDGHDFLSEAIERGAHALIVDDARRTTGMGVPVFEVPDTLVALGQLALYRRNAWARPVIAVGGSNGKTSTKDILRAALGSVYQVHATVGNLNNRIGAPLTLLALDDYADLAVVEAGTNEPGEIELLREIIRPDVAVITTVQEEHLEGLGDLAGVMDEEMSLADGVDVCFVPSDEKDVVREARARAGRVVTAGLASGDRYPTAYGLHSDGTGWMDWDGVRLEIPLRGEHNLKNAALAMAVVTEFGVSAENAARGLAGMTTPSMRSELVSIGSAILLNDAYNANPASMRAALRLLQAIGEGRQRVAVLGTMREMGVHSARAHDEIAGEALEMGFDILCGVGDFAFALKDRDAGTTRVITSMEVEPLWSELMPHLKRNAAILLKGSRGVALERLVPSITSWGAGAN